MPTNWTWRTSPTTTWTGRTAITRFGSYLCDRLWNRICDRLWNPIIVYDPNGDIAIGWTTWTWRTLI